MAKQPRFEMYRHAVWENVPGSIVQRLGKPQWRWRLVAANGEIIASGESYKRKVDCRAAVEFVRTNAASITLSIIDQKKPAAKRGIRKAVRRGE